MISFVAVLMLSFLTLCLGTYVADRVEQHCAACGEVVPGPGTRRAKR